MYKIVATPVQLKDLRPGQLFSSMPESEWTEEKLAEDSYALIYLFTGPVPEGAQNIWVTRIEVQDDEEGSNEKRFAFLDKYAVAIKFVEKEIRQPIAGYWKATIDQAIDEYQDGVENSHTIH